MRRLIGRLLLSMAIACAALAARGETLTLAHDFYPPYVDPDAKGHGLAGRKVSALLAAQGYDVRFEIVTWREVLVGAIDGTYDGVVGAWHAEERVPFLAFSEPYMINRLVLFSSADAPVDVRALSDLTGSTVGLIDGYVYPPELMASSLFTRAVEIDNARNLLKLSRGRIDFIVDDEQVGWWLMNRFVEQGRMKQFDLRTHPLLIAEHGMRIAITRKRADHQEIIDRVNEALAQDANG